MPQRWRHRLSFDTLSGLQLFQLIRYGSLVLLAILFPQIGISRSEIGHYEVFLFFAGVVTFFWLTGLIQGLLPLVKTKDKRWGGGGELFNAAVLLLLFSLGSGLVLWLLHQPLQSWMDQSLPEGVIGWLVLYVILFAPATLIEYWYVITQRSKMLLRYGMLAFTFQVLAVGVPVILTLDIRWAMMGLLLGGGFRFIWLVILLIREGQWQINVAFWKKHLALGLPIAISVLLSGSAQYVDGFIVNSRFDSAVFAIFRYGARELPLVALLAHALSNAMVPLFEREGTESALAKLKRRSGRLASWTFPMTAGLILVSYFVFPLLFKSGFVDSAGVFNLYLLLISSRLLFPQTILIAQQKTGILMWASGFELILNVGLSLILVQFWGIRGVALATVLAYYAERVILMIYLRRREGIRVRQYTHVSRYVTWTATLFGLWILTELFILPIANNF